MDTVSDRVYADETVVLDGTKFVRCKFTNVKFTYNGLDDFGFDGCTLEGACSGVLGAVSASVLQGLGILHGLGLIKVLGLDAGDFGKIYRAGRPPGN